MKKRHSWRGRILGFVITLGILAAIAFAYSQMWRAPLWLTLAVALVLSIPFTLLNWWIAEHPDDSWGAGYRPHKWE